MVLLLVTIIVHIYMCVNSTEEPTQNECETDGNLQTISWENLFSTVNNDGIEPSIDVSTYILSNTIGV